jgi:hypothetical protein
MTIRYELNRQKRNMMIIIFFGILFLFGMPLSFFHPNSEKLFIILNIISLIGVGIIAVTSWYTRSFGLKCPKCKKKWRDIVFVSGTLFAISKNIHFCPFCGTNIDKNIETA